MKHIFKYDLGKPSETSWRQLIETAPYKVEKLLTVQLQNGHAVLWAEVERCENANPLIVEAIWTGEPITDGEGEYCGTIQDVDGFVYHYYIQNPNDI